MSLSRRSLLRIGAGVTAGLLASRAARADNGLLPAAGDESGPATRGELRHGLSFFGDLKYPAGFAHFDYVNPAAPKGGPFSQMGRTTFYNQSLTTFDTLNPYNQRGNGAQGIELVYDTLMTAAGDEKSAMYARLATGAEIADEGLTYRFFLDPRARFHDGTPLTAADVVATFAALKADGYETIRMALRDLAGVEADGDHAVVMRFKPGRARDVPLTAAGMPIFSRAYLAKHPFKIGRAHV